MNEDVKRIIIISSSFPYTTKETFLHSEVLYLSTYFDIEIFPLIQGSDGYCIKNLPKNVIIHPPILKRNYFLRLFSGLFNKSPFVPYLNEIQLILKSKGNNTKKIFGSFTKFFSL